MANERIRLILKKVPAGTKLSDFVKHLESHELAIIQQTLFQTFASQGFDTAKFLALIEGGVDWLELQRAIKVPSTQV